MKDGPTPAEECSQIVDVLEQAIPTRVEGKEAILELRDADYQWRQMEWIGWYFEHASIRALISALGGTPGPRFGRTRFDYQRHHVWDLKAHPTTSSSGTPARSAVLNDQEAVQGCIDQHGGVGFIIACGTAEYDHSGEFKAWHDELKGGISRYERQRIVRDAPSRPRKVAYNIDAVESLFFSSDRDLARGLSEGWLRYFQEGMRNADGSPRRRKYMVEIDAAPDWARPLRPRRKV